MVQNKWRRVLNGISSINDKIIVSGGMAGDNAHFTQTFYILPK